MALLEILEFPDERLRQIAKPVVAVDASIRQLVTDMLETMYKAPGIGLAATQVNMALEVIVIDISETRDQPLCLINPCIVQREGRAEADEGCLSVPSVFEKVTRAESVTVRALDAHGKEFEIEANGLLAVCIQHEMDHLQGKLFVDYLSPLKRQLIRKKLKKHRKERSEAAPSGIPRHRKSPP